MHRVQTRARRHAVGRSVDGLGQVVEPAPVVERDAEQLGDDKRRHLARDVGDGVALAPLDHGVDDLGGELVDAQPQPFRRPGRELAVDDAPQPGVDGGSDVIIIW